MKLFYPENSYAERMVQTQIASRGIRDRKLLDAMSHIPRDRFITGVSTYEAYGDYPLSIGHGQTISQPYMVALMTEELRLRGSEKVLEIGTGSGYQTAVLAELAGIVYTVELIPALLKRSRTLLADLGYTNIAYRIGDGSLGWREHSPYDRILVAAAASTVPPTLTAELADNGIMVVPVGDSRQYQTLVIIRRVGGRFESRESIGCRFVPLVQKHDTY